MRQIVPDVYLIEGLRAAHAYLLVSEEGLTLVDSGSPGETSRIVSQLEEGGHDLSDLWAIVITHAHSDHTAGAAELVRRSGARVMAHRDEVVYIQQESTLPFASFLQRAVLWLSDRVFRTEPCHVDRALEDGDVVDALGGLQVIHVPGHTPGSIALYQPERQILFVGDSVFPILVFTVDRVQAEESKRKLAALDVQAVCFGHHEPATENASQKLREALR